MSYNYQNLHDDLNKKIVIGQYGGSNAIYYAITSCILSKNISYGKKNSDEYFIEDLKNHLNLPQTRMKWDFISSFDPLGYESDIPTISATRSVLNINELNDLECDGTVIDKDGGVNVTKIAVDYVFNLPKLSEKIDVEESKLRDYFEKSTNNIKFKDKNIRCFLPPTDGMTVYIFGDIKKLSNKDTEIAVRVHDECNGSDVFGTDICTCRPYLIYSLKIAIQCAQRNGVGIIVYFRKEGRCLGEVIKFRVYNARKLNGDCSKKYFYHTENIVGIRDARIQEIMPDVLLWLGITRIDWLVSMSNEKYEAITNTGIEVMQRIALPKYLIPKDAFVEINAKITAGYHSNDELITDHITKLKLLTSVREKCQKIYNLSVTNELKHFKVNMECMSNVVDKVTNYILKNHSDLKIPYHGRFRHFEVYEGPNITQKLLDLWPHVDLNEKIRRMIDLTVVSVLLDAGAGDHWKYNAPNGKTYYRSEGLAIVSLNMFKDGLFSSDIAVPHRVNSHGLKNLNRLQFEKYFQITEENKLVGLDGRFNILKKLGNCLEKYPEFFGHELCRPGNILDYIHNNIKDNHISINTIWKCLIIGFENIWTNTQSNLCATGDMWIYTPLKVKGMPGSDIVPFHKLTQWLLLSILEPLKLLGIHFDDSDDITPLPEYRNGGLLIDMNVLELKNQDYARKRHHNVGSELIVEWRALTVILIDKIADQVKKRFSNHKLSLSQILQCTWTLGREIAKEKRIDGSPPIQILSDGTVF